MYLKSLTLLVAMIGLLLFINLPCWSQSTTESPVDHMQVISEVDEVLQKKYLNYMSTVAHGNSARKLEKRREDLVNSIQQSIRDVAKVRPYKGDASLRDAYLGFLRVLLSVFKEDYHKIVNMEAIAEQSFDNMEAYLTAREQAGMKLQEAADKIDPAYKAFAASHNVRLVEPDKENKVAKKLEKVGKVNAYYHQVFLIEFKCSHQEGYLLKAVEAADVNALEQSRNTLLKYVDEGLEQLNKTGSFNSDGSLLSNCKKVLDFYKMEAADKAPLIRDYLIKKEEFEKLKKTLEAKKNWQQNQADIDQFNKAVAEVNESIGQYNKNIQQLNSSREKVLEEWNAASRRFLDSHMPTSK